MFEEGNTIKTVSFIKRVLTRRRRLLQAVLAVVLAAVAWYYAYPAAQTVYSAAERKLPIYSVDTEEKKIALTFDAAWGSDDTDELIAVLDKYNAKATFFVCGYWATDNAEALKKLYDAGHEIGNHGNTHAHVATLDLDNNIKEITGAHDAVKEILGVEMNLYRPAYGEYNNTVITAAEQSGYYTIQWDVDSLDWKEYGVEAEIKQVLEHKSLGNGSILLFHNDSPYTPEALDTILAKLTADGYELVKVSDLIYTEDYTIDANGRQHSGK